MGDAPGLLVPRSIPEVSAVLSRRICSHFEIRLIDLIQFTRSQGVGKLAVFSRGISMPYVNIKITREGATPEQKAELISGVTALLRDVLGKNPQTTVVVIDEVETDNWGIGGETVTVRRSRGS